MRQAVIRCLCRQHILEDLGITLVKDESITLTEDQVRHSRDLAHAQQSGAVSLRYVTVAKLHRSPELPPAVPQTPRLQSPPVTFDKGMGPDQTGLVVGHIEGGQPVVDRVEIVSEPKRKKRARNEE